jgi:hypothetical protein
MANMVIPNQGKIKLLDWAIHDAGAAQENFWLALYSNNYTPDDNTTLSNFTEATFLGYQLLAVLRSQMTATALLANVAYQWRVPTPVYNCTGGAAQTIYGWYLVSQQTNQVIAAQRFDVPRVMSPGATESLDPFRFALKSFA